MGESHLSVFQCLRVFHAQLSALTAFFLLFTFYSLQDANITAHTGLFNWPCCFVRNRGRLLILVSSRLRDVMDEKPREDT